MNINHKTAILLGCLTTLLCWACTSNQQTGNSNQKGNPAKAIYMKNCLICHGAKGNIGINGAAKLPKSTLSKADVIDRISNGKGKMQAFKNSLSAQEIDLVADYVIQFRPKK